MVLVKSPLPHFPLFKILIVYYMYIQSAPTSSYQTPTIPLDPPITPLTPSPPDCCIFMFIFTIISILDSHPLDLTPSRFFFNFTITSILGSHHLPLCDPRPPIFSFFVLISHNNIYNWFTSNINLLTLSPPPRLFSISQ